MLLIITIVFESSTVCGKYCISKALTFILQVLVIYQVCVLDAQGNVLIILRTFNALPSVFSAHSLGIVQLTCVILSGHSRGDDFVTTAV